MTTRQTSPVGLCERCAHVRVIRTPRSEFLLCERSKDDPAFARYPRLPVLTCAGFESRPKDETPPDGSSERGSEG